MSKDPAFLFYYQDFAYGTRKMTFEEKGAYIELLCEQADLRRLSLDDIKRTLKNDFPIWERICCKFICDEEGFFYNETLRGHIEKRKNYVESRKKNLKKPDMESHMESHMENVNVNVNKDINNNCKIPYQEIIEYLNLKTGKHFDHRTKETRAKIKARWGANGSRRTLEDFKTVINNKCAKWLADPAMIDYLRPETLFGTKFESYLNEQIVKVDSDKYFKNINS